MVGIPEWRPPAKLAGNHLDVGELPGRQEGKTTRQLQAAPQDAVYVWPNDHLAYPKALARHLGRIDLLIVAPGWLCDAHLCGRICEIVIDHAAYLTLRKPQWQAYHYHRERMEQRRNLTDAQR